MSRYQAKTYAHIDANHREIADALRRAGFSVGETSASANMTDLVVSGGNHSTVLMEIKVNEKGAKFQLSQIEQMARWKGYVFFVSSAEMAIRAMRNLDTFALTERQKQKLLQFAARRRAESKAKNPLVLATVIEREINDV